MTDLDVRSCMLSVFRQNRKIAAILFTVAILAVVVNLLPPQILRLIVDENLVTGDLNGLWSLAVVYICVLISIAVVDFIKGCAISVIGQRIFGSIRMAMSDKLSRLRPSYFTEHNVGEITSHMTTDAENVNTLFSEGIVNMVVDLLKIVGIVISIGLFSYLLALIALCVIPLVYAISYFFRKRMLNAQIDNLEQLGTVNDSISESIRNAQMIKLFNKEGYMERRYCDRLQSNYRTKQKVNFYDSCYAPVIQILRASVITLIVFLASAEMQFVGMTVGMVVASIDLMSGLLAPIESLGMELQNIQKGVSGVKRIDAFLSADEDMKDDTIVAEDVRKEIETHGISLENVFFSYGEKQVLRNISIDVAPGDRITIFGRTGVGKTTLFNLIMGLLTPDSGHVLIGDTEAGAIPDKEKRRIFGYVEQSFEFIPGTIADQISLGDKGITMDRIRSTCSFVGLDDAILSMKDGYSTEVDGNTEFSWGQRQLFSIARAIVTDPPLLLLDEITANLDSDTEEQILKVLDDAMSGRTIISISHRGRPRSDRCRPVYIENGCICDITGRL